MSGKCKHRHEKHEVQAHVDSASDKQMPVPGKVFQMCPSNSIQHLQAATVPCVEAFKG